MPFRSEKQRRLMFRMAEHGEMPMATVEKWQKATGKKHLPLYAPKKKKVSEEKGEKRKDNEKSEK